MYDYIVSRNECPDKYCSPVELIRKFAYKMADSIVWLSPLFSFLTGAAKMLTKLIFCYDDNTEIHIPFYSSSSSA